MACTRPSLSVKQPKVGVVYESNFLKNSEENVILCLFCMGFTTASVFTRWGDTQRPTESTCLRQPCLSLISWQWPGCLVREEGRATHPERERPHLQETLKAETMSRKTSLRFRGALHRKAGFHSHPHHPEHTRFLSGCVLHRGPACVCSVLTEQMLAVGGPVSSFFKGLFPHGPII